MDDNDPCQFQIFQCLYLKCHTKENPIYFCFFEWLDVSYHESDEKKYEGAEVYNYIFIYEDIRLSTSSDILLFKEEEINYIMMMHLMKTEKGYILKS